MVKPSDD